MSKWNNQYSSANQNLSETFSLWEERGRGWHLWDLTVESEPPFVPFAHLKQSSHSKFPLDDGRIKRRWNPFASSSNNLLATANEIEVVPKTIPPIIRNAEPVSVFTISFPKELKIVASQTEQLLLNLAHSTAWLSFEIIGSESDIIWQIICPNKDAFNFQRQLEAHYPNLRFEPKGDCLADNFALSQTEQTVIVDFGLGKEWFLPLTNFKTNFPNIVTPLIAGMETIQSGEVICLQILIQRTRHSWQGEVQTAVNGLSSNSRHNVYATLLSNAKEKLSSPLLAVNLRLAVKSNSLEKSWQLAKQTGAFIKQFSNPNGNELIPLKSDDLTKSNHLESILSRTTYRSGMLLGIGELASLAHFPSETIISAKIKRESQQTKSAPNTTIGHSFILGENTHQGKTQIVSVSEETRTRHLLAIGSTGSGKTNALIYYALQDISQNMGCAVFDVHGDLIDDIVENIPEHRIKDVILFDPSDGEFPIGFNPLTAHSETEKTLLTSDLTAIFKDFSTSWGDVMQSVLANAILAFVESNRGGNLFELKRFFSGRKIFVTSF